MRCPKCGFISFDSLDSCRKCNKPLASVSVALHGSAYDCQSPVFLRFMQPEEAMEVPDNQPSNVIEEAEIEAPALAAMDGPLSRSAKPATATLAGTGWVLTRAAAPQPTEAASGRQEDTASARLGREKAAADQETLNYVLDEENRELPADLADISDLAPPVREQAIDCTEAEDDVDLDLDLDLGFDLRDLEDDGEFSQAKPLSDSRKRRAAPVDLDDSDLDFELDLGGLSLHDYDDKWQ